MRGAPIRPRPGHGGGRQHKNGPEVVLTAQGNRDGAAMSSATAPGESQRITGQRVTPFTEGPAEWTEGATQNRVVVHISVHSYAMARQTGAGSCPPRRKEGLAGGWTGAARVRPPACVCRQWPGPRRGSVQTFGLDSAKRAAITASLLDRFLACMKPASTT